MKMKSLAAGAVSLMLAATPVTSSAHGWHGGGWGHGGGFAFGVLAGTAALATAVLTLPFAVASAATPAYYAPPQGYYPPAPVAYAPQPAYYAQQPAYYAPPAYGYYPPQPPVYYAPGYYR